MRHADTLTFRESLEAIREVLEQPLRKRDEIAIETCPDALDQIQHAANRELAIRQLESDSTRLHEVQDALQRIEEGTFGICLRCDVEISPKRLQAVPWAALCRNCQDNVEQTRTEEVFAMDR